MSLRQHNTKTYSLNLTIITCCAEVQYNTIMFYNRRYKNKLYGFVLGDNNLKMLQMNFTKNRTCKQEIISKGNIIIKSKNILLLCFMSIIPTLNQCDK